MELTHMIPADTDCDPQQCQLLTALFWFLDSAFHENIPGALPVFSPFYLRFLSQFSFGNINTLGIAIPDRVSQSQISD